VALIVRSIEAALGPWRDVLGLELETIMDIESDRSGSPSWRSASRRSSWSTDGRDNRCGAIPGGTGEGFHHVCFEVANLAETAAQARDRRLGVDRHVTAPGREGSESLTAS